MHAVHDLRDRPEYEPTVVDRLWVAWWKHEGSTLDHLGGLVRASLGPGLVPTCFVAEDQAGFLGTASLIADDLALRPAFTPWLAALWVEPAARSRGIGGALVSRVAEAAFAGGLDRLFLYCVTDKVGFYTGLGWRAVEHDVGPGCVSVLDLRPAWAAPARP